jgi:alanine dehydrogenase
MLVLNRQAVEAALDPDRLLATLERSFLALSAQPELSPPRTAVAIGEADAALHVQMPAYDPGEHAVGTKLMTVFPGNPAVGLPYGQGVITLFSTRDGAPLAVLDARYVTEVRTAATSAIATRLLAGRNAARLAILGTGVQAAAHARFMTRVRPIESIRLAGRDPEKVQMLATALSAELDLPVTPCPTYEAAVRGSDLVCGTTHSEAPVILGDWLAPGMHVNSVGLNRGGREIDAETVRRSLVVVESRPSAMSDPVAGSNDLMWPVRDGVISADHVRLELGDLISGRDPGRTRPDEITLFKSVGAAIEDIAAAALAVELAREQGLGVEVDVT